MGGGGEGGVDGGGGECGGGSGAWSGGHGGGDGGGGGNGGCGGYEGGDRGGQLLVHVINGNWHTGYESPDTSNEGLGTECFGGLHEPNDPARFL